MIVDPPPAPADPAPMARGNHDYAALLDQLRRWHRVVTAGAMMPASMLRLDAAIGDAPPDDREILITIAARRSLAALMAQGGCDRGAMTELAEAAVARLARALE